MEIFSVAQNGIWTSFFFWHSTGISPGADIYANENVSHIIQLQ